MPRLFPLVISGTGTCHELSVASARAICKCLRDDFPRIAHITQDEASVHCLATMAPDAVLLAHPLHSVEKLAETLDKLGVPCVGRIGMSGGQVDLDMAETLLMRAGLPVGGSFRLDLGDDRAVLAEGYTPSQQQYREFSVAVMDQIGGASVQPIIEVSTPAITQSGRQQMYMGGDSDGTYLCPAPLPDRFATEAREIALKAHSVLDLEISRTTLLLGASGLEIGRVSVRPVMLPGSLFCRATQAAGREFDDLCWHLVCQAAARHLGQIDVQWGSPGPAGLLSNFQGHPFVFDEKTHCACMEGLLQAIKTDDPETQATLVQLSGKDAKREGSKYNTTWQVAQTLWFAGVGMNRSGQEYQDFLDRAYEALFDQSADFRCALRQSGQAVLRHSVAGRDSRKTTVLTEREFVRRLYLLREKLEGLP